MRVRAGHSERSIVAAPPDDDTTSHLRGALDRRGIPSSELGIIAEVAGERVYTLRVSRDDAETRWQELWTAVDQLGRWPVDLGTHHEAGIVVERLTDEPPAPRREIAAADSLDLDGWWTERRARFGSTLARGPWPEPEPSRPARQRVPFDRKGRPPPAVTIALPPTRSGAEALAWLGFGRFNECPETVVHVALFRQWEARYGAVVREVGPDRVEARVARPPTQRGDALELAELLALYDRDLLQGRTVEQLAAGLVGAERWGFWWD